MSAPWSGFLDEVKSTKGFAEADALKSLITGLRTDPLGFLMVQGEMLEMYLEQLAAREMSTEEFEASVKTIRDLIEIESVKMSPEDLERAAGIIAQIDRLILQSLVVKLSP